MQPDVGSASGVTISLIIAVEPAVVGLGTDERSVRFVTRAAADFGLSMAEAEIADGRRYFGSRP
jgi:hypothetical protein